MIIDTIENSASYFDNEGWNKAVDFLKTMDPECSDGEYEIQGDDVFARVMTYETKLFQEAFPEAHKNYVDIQVVMSGRELIVWNPLRSLEEKTAYDEQRDLAFYDKNHLTAATMQMDPGVFAVFFPQDGHMPSIAIEDKQSTVKKVVIKIKADYF